MGMRRVYSEELAVGDLILSREESHHIISVLRGRVGDSIELFDGDGHLGDATIRAVKRNQVTVSVTSVSTADCYDVPRRVTLFVAVPKAPRQGFLVEKCTELGVAGIRPIQAARSVARLTHAGVAKWRRRAVEAAKQSRRVFLPGVLASVGVEESWSDAASFDACGVLDFGEHATPCGRWVGGIPAGARVAVWIGPEGGWSDDERAAYRRAGLNAIGMGRTVLRIETAAVAACALLTG